MEPGTGFRLTKNTACSVVVFAAVVIPLACRQQPFSDLPDQPQATRPNVVLISIDTLRADHLGLHGYFRNTSPAIDQFARDAHVYLNAFAPAPWTLPSHAGMLTGVHPFDLGIHRWNSSLPETVPTLAEILEANGYQTVAFVDSAPDGVVGGNRGFARGFEEYIHAPLRDGLAIKYDIAVSTDFASRWLIEKDGDRPFFLFLHTKSVHAIPYDSPCLDHRCFPYDKPEPYRFRFIEEERAQFSWSDPERGKAQEYLWSWNRDFLSGKEDPKAFPTSELDVLKALYDGGIAYTDEFIRQLLDSLAALELLENTLVIITSDHGEAFLEHNLFMHQEVYEQLLHVPLIVRTPGVERGIEISQLVSILDIVPTVLRIVGIDPPGSLAGRVLPQEPITDPTDRWLFGYYLCPPSYTYRAFTVFNGTWKLVRHNLSNVDRFEDQLFEVHRGRHEVERTGLADNTLATLRTHLELRTENKPSITPTLFEPSTETLELLKTIGYID